MVIYPGRYRGGPTFDVAGQPGDLTATSAADPGQARLICARGTAEAR